MIEIKDEVIEGQPKYNIIDNKDGTYSIELANKVVQEGTPLNRFLFESIDEGSQHFTDIDDITFESGSFYNAGAGWNSYQFENELDYLPDVITQVEGEKYRVQIQSVTQTGFLYRVLEDTLTTTVTTTTDATTAVTDRIETNVDSTDVKIYYIAISNGGKG